MERRDGEREKERVNSGATSSDVMFSLSLGSAAVVVKSPLVPKVPIMGLKWNNMTLNIHPPVTLYHSSLVHMQNMR